MPMQVERKNAFDLVCETLADKGFDVMAQVMQTLCNEVMQIERENHLAAYPYERTEERRGYANGYKPKALSTRIGQLNLEVPQVRNCDFYPSFLEKGLRSERALSVTLAEMYIQGVSTRKVEKVLQKMCGLEVSSTQVSKATKALDEEFKKWRERPIGEIVYLILDARYEKVRQDGHVMDAALLTAIGITASGKREILGASVSYSEHEVHWRKFLEQLVSRGMHGVKLVISDAHSGLKAARKAVFPTCPWQRCQFHLQQNAQAYVPRVGMRKQVAQDIRYIFASPDREEAQRLLDKTAKKYEQSASKLAQWMVENIPEAFAVFSFPEAHRIKLRTSNLIERTNKLVKKRTAVVGIFPNEDSCLRLATAILIEVSEKWLVEKNYMKMNEEG